MFKTIMSNSWSTFWILLFIYLCVSLFVNSKVKIAEVNAKQLEVKMQILKLEQLNADVSDQNKAAVNTMKSTHENP